VRQRQLHGDTSLPHLTNRGDDSLHGKSESQIVNPARLSAIRIVKVTRQRPRQYDQALRQALTLLWEASGRMCAKRLKALVPVLLPALERNGHLRLDPAMRGKLFLISAATIDRLLREVREVREVRSGEHGPRLPTPRWRSAGRLPSQEAVMAPGHMELRLSSHRRQFGGRIDIPTLSLTDSFSGWTECGPLRICDQGEALRCIDTLRDHLPFPIRAVVLDGGPAFLEATLQHWRHDHAVEVFRSSPSRDGGVAPACAGRPHQLQEAKAMDAFSRLYAAYGLHLNFFHCSFRLKDKSRVASRIVRRYYAPQTPCARLLDSKTFGEQGKSRLRSIAEALDPLQLLAEVRDLQSQLALLADVPGPDTTSTPGSRPGRRALKTPKPQRHWRTHENPFEARWPIIQSWLQIESHQTSKELFERLRREYPGVYREGQLRSLQRQLNQWRNRPNAAAPATATITTTDTDTDTDTAIGSTSAQ